MNTAIQSIGLDDGFGPGAAAEGRDSGSWKRTIWSDEGRSNTIVAVWKAEPGTYVFPPRALEETFIVAEGEALCTLGGKPAAKIGAGSIVRVREGEAITLEILSPFRKLATVVLRS
jgi:uncharacterized cupin superfamily protein